MEKGAEPSHEPCLKRKGQVGEEVGLRRGALAVREEQSSNKMLLRSCNLCQQRCGSFAVEAHVTTIVQVHFWFSAHIYPRAPLRKV